MVSSANTPNKEWKTCIFTIKEQAMKRQKCEVFSRSMGFIRPIDNFNIGKRSEFEERNTFKETRIFDRIKSLLKKK